MAYFFWTSAGELVIDWLSLYNLEAPPGFMRGLILPDSVWTGALQAAIILSTRLISVYPPLYFRRRPADSRVG